MEIELKLLLDPADVATFRRHPLLKQRAIAKPLAQQLTSIYFDTPDLYFKRHDSALRVRRVNRDWIQTLKGGGQVTAGLHQREEWESEVDGPHLDLPALNDLVGHDTSWAKILAVPKLADKLIPIFTTTFRRTTWQLQSAHGDEVELALDQGDVQHGATRIPISEVELELKSGNPDALFDLALQLQYAVPLRISDISKAERGYALYAPQPPAVVKASCFALSTKLTVEQGFHIIVGNCLAQVQGNEAGVVQGHDPESVHQMRIGLRRLRAALTLFAQVTPCPAALRTELKWLAAELGAARDWEVFVGSTLAVVVNACADKSALHQLQQAALVMALNNRKKAAAAVSSARYARLLLSLGSWLQKSDWRAELAQPERERLEMPLAKFATQTLKLCHGKLEKRGKHLKEGAPSARHRVRIAAKNVRYATEFFQSLYPARQVRPFVHALTGLQDALGWLNDATVAEGLLRRLAHNHPALTHSAGFVAGYLVARTEQDARQLDKLWQQFKRLKCPDRK
ncbi:CYTH and CHAD domain-containing protein [Glaciimonas soli]|nr:CYTH and CHAD domain-containing protein [Glaciimonas soli]